MNLQNLRESTNNPLILLTAKSENSARSISSDSDNFAADSLDFPILIKHTERIYKDLKDSDTFNVQLKQTQHH